MSSWVRCSFSINDHERAKRTNNEGALLVKEPSEKIVDVFGNSDESSSLHPRDLHRSDQLHSFTFFTAVTAD